MFFFISLIRKADMSSEVHVNETLAGVYLQKQNRGGLMWKMKNWKFLNYGGESYSFHIWLNVSSVYFDHRIYSNLRRLIMSARVGTVGTFVCPDFDGEQGIFWWMTTSCMAVLCLFSRVLTFQQLNLSARLLLMAQVYFEYIQ